MEMHPEYNPHHTFLATWALMELINSDGLWPSNYGREGRGKTPLPPPTDWIPQATSCGTCCTTGGLALYIGDEVPNWIETPWGEWCWGRSRNLVPYPDDRACLGKLLDLLDIDEKHSCMEFIGWPRLGSIALQSIEGIRLPPRKSINVSKRGIFRVWGEWIALCTIHNKPMPACAEEEQFQALGLQYMEELERTAA